LLKKKKQEEDIDFQHFPYYMEVNGCHRAQTYLVVKISYFVFNRRNTGLKQLKGE